MQYEKITQQMTKGVGASSARSCALWKGIQHYRCLQLWDEIKMQANDDYMFI